MYHISTKMSINKNVWIFKWKNFGRTHEQNKGMSCHVALIFSGDRHKEKSESDICRYIIL